MSIEKLKYGLKPKNGFYEFPYVANSPETLVESFDKMPFTKHSQKKRLLSSDTPFLKGKTNYNRIEEGLWVFYSDIEYKENLSFKTVESKELPSDYYTLSIRSSGNFPSKKRTLINGQAFYDQSWLLFKPKANNSNYIFKGSKETSFTVYFSEKWLRKVLYKKKFFLKSSLKNFFESNARYIIWPDTDTAPLNLIQQTARYFENNPARIDGFQKSLNTLVNDSFREFAEKYNLDNVSEKFYEIPSKDRKEILRSQKSICENLNAKFRGIDALSGTAGMSPTKYKRCFKLVYGMSPYQYFQAKQMVLAKELLLKNEYKVGEIAKLFQYENTGKFSLAFRKSFGCLPSEINNQ